MLANGEPRDGSAGVGLGAVTARPEQAAQARHQPHPWRPARFMVIAAHPDDADFGPAATAASWIDAGSSGWLVCLTSGDAGSEDPDADPLELAALREREQRAAAAIVGYEGVSFLHQPDGALANDLALRELLVREIRTFRPDAVLCTDPEAIFHTGGGVNHTDHRAAGIAAVDAVYPAARNPMAFPHLARGGLAKHVVRRLYLFWSERPDAWVDVSATLDRKLAALRAHESQIHDPARLEEHIRTWAAEEGENIARPAADAFRLIVIEDDPAGEDAGAGEDATAEELETEASTERR
ncbi:MAG TPA: PIG-L deacetylase family protein [Candidatus Dormibacteraeota bacterium]|nr:PIG-L deacetylase family protein [Candidatus Dormibacteraeota bacterium]